MELLPAIDLRAGRVVRLQRGDAAAERVYHPDPFAVLEGYLAAGARWVHIVDLDRVYGFGDQADLVAALVRRARVPVQVGGGLISADDVAAMLDAGVSRVVLGTGAARSVRLLSVIAERFGADPLALAIDVRDGRVWARDLHDLEAVPPRELAVRARDVGLRLVTYTDIGREGGLAGAAVDAAAALSKEAGVGVIVCGGVSSLAEIARARRTGLAGAIVGRALFEGRFTLRDALACASSS